MPRHRPVRLNVRELESRVVPALGIPKSLVIAIDGLRGDGILNANTPNLRGLIDGTWGDGPGIDYRGAYADFATTILDAVTVSGPNHTSIFTGVTAAKHGVTGNNDAQMAAVTYPDYLKLLELNNPARGTAKLVSWNSDDLIPSGADYRRLALEELNSQLIAQIFASTPGTPYATATGTTNIDAVFHFYDNLDYAGHGSGFSPGNPAYRTALETIDGLIGLELTAIKNRPTFALEDWQIVVTSDHGGRGTGHGFAAADNYTIPFLVCSRSVAQGWLAGTPGNVDVTPTVLAHFNVPIPANIDGVARGSEVRSFPATTINQDRVANLKFDFNLLDSAGTASPIPASVGGGSPTYVAGKFGQAVKLNAATGDWLTLGSPAALQFGANTDFSFSLWYKADASLNGDPPILTNKSLNIAANPGFALSGNAGTGNDLGASISGAAKRDLNYVDINLGTWVFIAGTFDRDGNGFLYVGTPGNILYKLAQNIVPVGNINTPLPWNLGQDGTGVYPHGLTAAIDELSIWRRELTHEEIRALYGNGGGAPTPPLVAYPDQYTLNENDSLTLSAPGLLANDAYPASVLYQQNFDSLPLGPAVNEGGGDGTDWTDTPPAGWTVDDSGVPGAGTGNDGMTEWAGWSFADKTFWTTVSGNQNRTDFTLGSGTIAVADPDEWDDAPHPAGTYNAWMTTPAVTLAGVQANTLTLNFDSSFRPFGTMQGVIDVSFNNFASSTRIFTRTTQDLRDEPVSIPINNPAAGSVRFRFGLIDAGNDWWWAIDNLAVKGVTTAATLTAALVTPPLYGSATVNANGSFTYTPLPGFSGMDQFTYSAYNGTSSGTAPVTLTVQPRPAVTGVVVNNGEVQRSRVLSLTVAFDAAVNQTLLQTPGTFTMTRSDGVQVGIVTATPATVNGNTVVTLTFGGPYTDYASLFDGVWTLRIEADNIVSTSGPAMIADYSQGGIRRLFGDIDGNGTVDGADFGSFGATFGLSQNQSGFLAAFDFEANSTIDGADFARFGNRFGVSL